MSEPTPEDIAAYHADMAARPADPPPTDEELEAMVRQWLERHEAHVRAVDEYFEALRRPGPAAPF